MKMNHKTLIWLSVLLLSLTNNVFAQKISYLSKIDPQLKAGFDVVWKNIKRDVESDKADQELYRSMHVVVDAAGSGLIWIIVDFDTKKWQKNNALAGPYSQFSSAPVHDFLKQASLIKSLFQGTYLNAARGGKVKVVSMLKGFSAFVVLKNKKLNATLGLSVDIQNFQTPFAFFVGNAYLFGKTSETIGSINEKGTILTLNPGRSPSGEPTVAATAWRFFGMQP